ncbi:MAG: hypothetical protein NTV49_10685 [Kiritimatiellaeota bacterium]|nr:hypothetical protein [Kiritimatiellota bacterium]
MNKRRIWSLFILTFVAGVLAGAAGMQAYQHVHIRRFMHSDSDRQHELFLRRMNQELTLTAAQQAQVQAIMRDTREQLTRLRQRTQPDVRRLLQENRQQIEKLLTPDQTARYRQMLDRWSSTKSRRPGDDPSHEEHPSRRHRSTNTVER